MRKIESTHDYSIYNLGTILAVHTIGEFEIVEYQRSFGLEISFKPFRNGISYPRSYGNLEQAIIGAIAIKYDGGNTKADTYFLRAIQHPTTNK